MIETTFYSHHNETTTIAAHLRNGFCWIQGAIEIGGQEIQRGTMFLGAHEALQIVETLQRYLDEIEAVKTVQHVSAEACNGTGDTCQVEGPTG